MNKDQITKLAKTFSAACKDAVEKGKVQTYTAPIVLSVAAILLSQPAHGTGWAKLD